MKMKEKAKGNRYNCRSVWNRHDIVANVFGRVNCIRQTESGFVISTNENIFAQRWLSHAQSARVEVGCQRIHFCSETIIQRRGKHRRRLIAGVKKMTLKSFWGFLLVTLPCQESVNEIDAMIIVKIRENCVNAMCCYAPRSCHSNSISLLALLSFSQLLLIECCGGCN